MRDTPWYSKQDFANTKLDEVLGKENDEDESDNQKQRSNDGLAVTKPFSDYTGHHQAKNLPDQSSVAKAGLPCSCQLISAIRLDDTKLLREWGIREQIP